MRGRRAARRAAGSLALSLALAWASPALATGEEDAAAFFRAARAAYARREYRPAATAFEAAYRAAPHPAAMYNAGIAWELAGEPGRAADAYVASLALRDRLAPAEAADAEARLGALAPTLARIEIQAPRGARVTVGHLEAVAAPVTVHVAPGDHPIAVSFEGGATASRRVTAPEGTATPVRFEAPAAPPPAAAGAPAGPVLPEAPAVDRSASASPLRTVGWAAAIGGVALGAAAVITGLQALSARDEFFASGRTDAGAHDRAATLRTWTNVAWIAAGVAEVGGITLLIVTRGRDPASARVRLAPGGAAVAGRF